MDGAALAEARRIIAELVARAGEVATHTEVYDLEPGYTPQAPRVRRIKTPHRVHPLFWDIARLRHRPSGTSPARPGRSRRWPAAPTTSATPRTAWRFRPARCGGRPCGNSPPGLPPNWKSGLRRSEAPRPADPRSRPLFPNPPCHPIDHGSCGPLSLHGRDFAMRHPGCGRPNWRAAMLAKRETDGAEAPLTRTACLPGPHVHHRKPGAVESRDGPVGLNGRKATRRAAPAGEGL